MARFVPKRQEQILAQMIAKVISRTDLSDVADSSSVKQVLSAAARQDDEIYYQLILLLQLFSIDTATGDDLDQRAAEIQPATIARIQAQKASGSVVFSRAGTTGTVNVPIGTKVKTATGEVFTTQAVATITPSSPEQVSGHGVGRDSNSVSVVADVGGASGNVASGTVTKFEGGKPSGVNEVTNLAAFTNGLDRETDDAFRQRIKDFIAGLARCTVQAIEANVLGQVDPVSERTVTSAKAVEDIEERGEVTLYIDDGSGAIKTTTAIVGENVTQGVGSASHQKGIVPVTGAELIDGETFVLDDGTNIITFEFDDDASVVETATLRQVVFTSGDSRDTVGAAIRTAINASAILATATGDVPVVVTHDSGPGNTLSISDTVADTDFVVGNISAAVGGETRLFLDNKPIDDTVAISLTSSTRGALTRDTGGGGDYFFNPANGQLNFDPALVQGEVITAGYTHFTGLIQFIQKVVDGDLNDRSNFPGLRAAGVRVLVLNPIVLFQSVEAVLTVSDGFTQADVVADVETAVLNYINGLGISGDVIRAELIRRIMSVAGVINVSLVTPASDVILLDDQLPRSSTANLDIT